MTTETTTSKRSGILFSRADRGEYRRGSLIGRAAVSLLPLLPLLTRTRQTMRDWGLQFFVGRGEVHKRQACRGQTRSASHYEQVIQARRKVISRRMKTREGRHGQYQRLFIGSNLLPTKTTIVRGFAPESMTCTLTCLSIY